MKNSWAPLSVTLVLVAWLGFASTSNNRIEPKNNRSLTVLAPSAGAVRGHIELRRTDVVFFSRLDGRTSLYPRTHFACSGSDCCCVTGSADTAKCLPPKDCTDIGGRCGSSPSC
jgi:hypothetical protein